MHLSLKNSMGRQPLTDRLGDNGAVNGLLFNGTPLVFNGANLTYNQA